MSADRLQTLRTCVESRRQADKLRHIEDVLHAEFTEEQFLQVEPEMREISETIKQLEVGNLMFCIGPGGKLFRAVKVNEGEESC